MPCRGCPSSDRFPSSVIYPSHTDVYSNGPGGFLVRPQAVSIFCSCYADCGSQGKSCGTRYGDANCRPGCMRPCDPSSGIRNWGCSWYGGDQLELMMNQQMVVRAGGGYNEVVLDPRSWVAHLPQTIHAMFVLPVSKDSDIRNVREVHAKFLSAYGMTSDAGPPIVMYDPKGSPNAPFRHFGE